jgi:6-pyruvoyltetrahydropterin/6-carboxytetrahydropterin synthase
MLKDDTSKCYNPHGHEYVLEVSVEGPLQEEGNESGMVMHFGTLKELMMNYVHDRLDHRFMLQNTDPRCMNMIKTFEGSQGLVLSSFVPTAEKLAEWIHNILAGAIISPYSIKRIMLKETSNCWVEYTPTPEDSSTEEKELLSVTMPQIGL